MLFRFKIVGDPRECEPYSAELANVAESRAEAARVLGDFLRDFPDALSSDGEVRLDVTNGEGLVQFSFVTFCVDAPATGR